MIFQTEKQLGEYGDKIPAEKKSVIESALADLKAAHEAEDLDKIDAASKAMNDAWQAASQDIYQATQNANAGGEQAQAEPTAENTTSDSTTSDSEDVTDVEYEEVEEDK